MTVNTTICLRCKGNGFKYLSFKSIAIEPCDECKMSGENIYTDYNSTQKLEGVSDVKQARC